MKIKISEVWNNPSGKLSKTLAIIETEKNDYLSATTAVNNWIANNKPELEQADLYHNPHGFHAKEL
jgi:hypothetical protein